MVDIPKEIDFNSGNYGRSSTKFLIEFNDILQNSKPKLNFYSFFKHDRLGIKFSSDSFLSSVRLLMLNLRF